MDEDKKQNIFEDKYQRLLGISYQEWLLQGPQNETVAYQWLNQIDKELSESYEEWFNALGEHKDELEEKRSKLKAMYDLIEEMFNLEAIDKDW
jgi:hypothetical protein